MFSLINMKQIPSRIQFLNEKNQIGIKCILQPFRSGYKLNREK